MKNLRERYLFLYIFLFSIGIYFPFFGLFLLFIMLSFFIFATYRGSLYYKNSIIDLFLKDIEKKIKLPKFIHSYFKGKLWCSVLCPKYSLLELFLKKKKYKNKIAIFLGNNEFSIIVYIIVLELFIYQIIVAEKTVYAYIFIFIRLCLSSGLIAFVIGIPIIKKTWCKICPMGAFIARKYILKNRFYGR